MSAPLVFVTVGTDTHPFDRLVGWVDELVTGAGADLRWVVQHGYSRPPTGPADRLRAAPHLGHDEIEAAMAEAVAVVAHGGPTTIAETRRRGRRPLVVPRRPEHGEHVDAHQVRFAERMAQEGLVRLVGSCAELADLLTGLAGDPDRFRLGPGEDTGTERAARRFGELADGLFRP